MEVRHSAALSLSARYRGGGNGGESNSAAEPEVIDGKVCDIHAKRYEETPRSSAPGGRGTTC